MPSPRLRVSRVSKRYGDRRALSDVSFSVPTGQVVGLLGPNGAGKTTLIRSIFGMVEPDEGEITWDGTSADRQTRESWGYMPQDRGVYTDMTVAAHIEWIGQVYGLSKPEAAARRDTLLDQLDIADRRDDNIKQLSGGVQQRVQLANALVHQPELLVLDEPFAGLDPIAIESLSALMLAHAEAGRTVLFSSHQLGVVERLCRSVILIDNGTVVLQGELATLRAQDPRRFLRVDADLTGLRPTFGELTAAGPGLSRVALNPGVDAVEALTELNGTRAVNSFAVESPNLSELFLAAVDQLGTREEAA